MGVKWVDPPLLQGPLPGTEARGRYDEPLVLWESILGCLDSPVSRPWGPFFAFQPLPTYPSCQLTTEQGYLSRITQVLLPTKIDSTWFSISSSQNLIPRIHGARKLHCSETPKEGTKKYIWIPSLVAQCASILPKAFLSSWYVNQTHQPNIKTSSYRHRWSIFKTTHS